MTSPADAPRRALVTVQLTALALVAFAANSVLCRLALAERHVDAWSFTAIRVVSGALALAALTWRRGRPAPGAGDWRRAGFLLLYALPFSLAYVELTTGTGALLLFGAVQLTMIALGLAAGERPGPLEWIGLLAAAAGLVYLVSPGVAAPPPLGAALMVVAGVGRGLYSIAGKAAGRGGREPTVTTAAACARAAALALPLPLVALSTLAITPRGAALAALSGAVTSGLGYAIWYAALRELTAVRAALVQLAVPVLAAAAGVALLGEAVTARLAIAGAVVLGGIALGVLGRRRRAPA